MKRKKPVCYLIGSIVTTRRNYLFKLWTKKPIILQCPLLQPCNLTYIELFVFTKFTNITIV